MFSMKIFKLRMAINNSGTVWTPKTTSVLGVSTLSSVVREQWIGPRKPWFPQRATRSTLLKALAAFGLVPQEEVMGGVVCCDPLSSRLWEC
mgnify:CR=1 FL=1